MISDKEFSEILDRVMEKAKGIDLEALYPIENEWCKVCDKHDLLCDCWDDAYEYCWLEEMQVRLEGLKK